MTDYVAVVLQGLFTGIGVILAHEFYDTFKKYRERFKNEIKTIVTNGEPKKENNS